MISMNEILKRLEGRLIVSCQAEEPEPLASPEMLTAMSRAAVLGGAAAIRSNLPQNVAAIHSALDVPVIGLYKKVYTDSEVYITPTLNEAKALLETGCEIIALDATIRTRPFGEQLKDITAYIRSNSDVLLMADVSTLEDGLLAADMGFDMISTTLSGYTKETLDRAKTGRPDYGLLADLARKFNGEIPVFAEGRIWTPEDAVQAFQTGAFAVVVGSAVTRPQVITQRINEAVKKYQGKI